MVLDLKTYGFWPKSNILFINKHIITLPQPHMKVYEGLWRYKNRVIDYYTENYTILMKDEGYLYFSTRASFIIPFQFMPKAKS